MKVRHRLIVLAGAAGTLLTGCGQQQQEAPVTQEAEAVAEAAAAAGAGIKPRPGRWQVQARMTEFDIPGMPESMKKTVGRQIGTAGSVTVCLTPEEAERNDGRFFQPRGKECSYQTFSMANGQIAARMTCKDGGATQTMDMRGSYSEDSYDLALTSQGDVNGAEMSMAMQMSGIRTGNCTGDEANPAP